MENQALKELLKELIINQKQTLAAKWDCGGDQAIIDYYLDGKQVHYQSQLYEALEDLSQLMIWSLELPEVGDYGVTGEGRFYFDDKNRFLIEYSGIGVTPSYPKMNWDEAAGKWIETYKYKNESIEEETIYEFPNPLLLHSSTVFFYAEVNHKKEIILKGSDGDLKDVNLDIIKDMFLNLEMTRVQPIIDSLEDNFVVRLDYEGTILENRLTISSIYISYTQEEHWNKVETILIQ